MAGRESFKKRGLLGIIELYECFPKHLQETIIRKQAELYNSLFELLTPEEREALGTPDNRYFNEDTINWHEEAIKTNRDVLADYENGRYTEEETRKRFPNMPEEFIQSRLTEYVQKTQELKDKISQQEEILKTLNKQKEFLDRMSKYFD